MCSHYSYQEPLTANKYLPSLETYVFISIFIFVCA